MKEFSKDLDKFNEDCQGLFSLLKGCLNAEEKISWINIERKNNLIYYQKNNQYKNTIEMMTNDDLRKIYDLIESRYSSRFETGFTFGFRGEYILNPIIGGNVMLEISSDTQHDIEWFFEKINYDKNDDIPKKI